MEEEVIKPELQVTVSEGPPGVIAGLSLSLLLPESRKVSAWKKNNQGKIVFLSRWVGNWCIRKDSYLEFLKVRNPWEGIHCYEVFCAGME